MLPNRIKFIAFRTGIFVKGLRYINVTLRYYSTCLFSDAANISDHLMRRNMRSLMRKKLERMWNDAVEL